METIIATVVNGAATFTVTELSPFAVFTVSKTSANMPNTGDDDGLPLWLGLIASGVLLSCLSLPLRRRLKRTKYN